MADRIRVLIADDHAVVRRGLRAFLQLQSDIDIVGEAAGGTETLALALEHQPDVILMDLVMPSGDGVGAIRAISEAGLAARILVLSSFSDDSQVFAAMEAGAAGYLLKDVEPEDLAVAIRQVNQGRPALHPEIASRLMRRVAQPADEDANQFTGRERDVLGLIAEGFANKEIARRLFISEKTVKTHVSNILGKLGVADRTQAAVTAIRRRLV